MVHRSWNCPKCSQLNSNTPEPCFSCGYMSEKSLKLKALGKACDKIINAGAVFFYKTDPIKDLPPFFMG